MNKYVYPKAAEWMWTYCHYLGPYEDPNTGKKLDLGVYVNNSGNVSAAIVCGNEDGDYYSGPLVNRFDDTPDDPKYQETLKRAKLAGLIKGDK